MYVRCMYTYRRACSRQKNVRKMHNVKNQSQAQRDLIAHKSALVNLPCIYSPPYKECKETQNEHSTRRQSKIIKKKLYTYATCNRRFIASIIYLFSNRD